MKGKHKLSALILCVMGFILGSPILPHHKGGAGVRDVASALVTLADGSTRAGGGGMMGGYRQRRLRHLRDFGLMAPGVRDHHGPLTFSTEGLGHGRAGPEASCEVGVCEGVVAALAEDALGSGGGTGDPALVGGATFDPAVTPGQEDGAATGATTGNGGGDYAGKEGATGATGGNTKPPSFPGIPGFGGGGGGGGGINVIPDPFDPAVPEPATWAMMVMGFGAVAYGLRRVRLRGGRKVA